MPRATPEELAKEAKEWSDGTRTPEGWEDAPHALVNKPNPGTKEALDLGCNCPVLDNGHGRGYMGQKGVFVWREDCPLHRSPHEQRTEPQER